MWTTSLPSTCPNKNEITMWPPLGFRKSIIYNIIQISWFLVACSRSSDCRARRSVGSELNYTPRFFFLREFLSRPLLEQAGFLDLFWRWEVKIRFLRNEMIYFTAFSFGYTATFFQTWIRATCLTSYPKQTTRQPSISFVIDDYRPIIVATNDSENWLSLYAD